MTIKKIHSEVKFSDSDFKIKICTIDKKNPEIIYTQIGTYLKPIEKKQMYSDEIINFDKKSKKYLQNKLVKSTKYNKDFIFVVDIADERINVDKKSFLEIQIHFKRKDKKDETFKELSKELYTDYISDFVLYAKKSLNEIGFEYFKNKK
jgi:hypothetical protein